MMVESKIVNFDIRRIVQYGIYEEWIEKELPVHIKANILWLNMEDMKTVEYNYKHWLSVKKSSSYDKEKVDSAAEALLEVLLKLKCEQK